MISGKRVFFEIATKIKNIIDKEYKSELIIKLYNQLMDMSETIDGYNSGIYFGFNIRAKYKLILATFKQVIKESLKGDKELSGRLKKHKKNIETLKHFLEGINVAL